MRSLYVIFTISALVLALASFALGYVVSQAPKESTLAQAQVGVATSTVYQPDEAVVGTLATVAPEGSVAGDSDDQSDALGVETFEEEVSTSDSVLEQVFSSGWKDFVGAYLDIELVFLEGRQIDFPAGFSVYIRPSGTMVGATPCNSFTGTLGVGQEVSQIGYTKRECADEGAYEEVLYRVLQNNAVFTVDTDSAVILRSEAGDWVALSRR